MPAGHSAADEAARAKLEAEQAFYAARTASDMHGRYLAAAGSESRLGALLEPLIEQDFHILSDRHWPGSRGAKVEYVIVGPSGVIIIDAKSWGDVVVHKGHVYQGDDDVTDRFANLRTLADQAQTSLAEIGMAPGEIRVVAVLMGKSRLHGYAGGVDLIGEDAALDYILNRGARLRHGGVAAALPVVEELFHPAMEAGRDVSRSAPLEPPVVTVGEVERALLTSILAKPIEDWMAFLHPDQAKLARRSFNGPSRIRGAAGTGKTVVGLHRAAHLARRRPGRVLVTTLMDTLPIVLASKMERMAPDVADRIEFRDIHSFALDLLTSRGVPVNLDRRAADAAFDAAWSEVGSASLLGVIDPREDYWKDEVISVIKGRGLTRFEDYAGLARLGRRRGLSSEARKAVWALYGEYEVALREAGIHDPADVILLAEQSLRGKPLLGYSAVIADEAQDLSVAMIRMLHSIVGDARDGLNLIGDGQQTIYPGGYTLAEADVSVAGRGVVMTRNYRNTVEIADFASELVAGDEFVDIEEPASLAAAPTDFVRRGMRPRVSRFTSHAGHDRSLIAQVRELIASGTSGGDIAVLTQTNFAATEVTVALSAAGIPWQSLSEYDGSTSSAVTVGTIRRAKGLEFKQVLVARTSAQLLETVWSSTDEAAAERRELERRELYVAMTRARDGVWVGVA
jgi:hypothetical protein